MSLPGFGAESSLGKSRGTYREKSLYSSFINGQSGQPAIVLPSQLPLMEEIIDVDEMGDEDLEYFPAPLGAGLDNLEGSEETFDDWVVRSPIL